MEKQKKPLKEKENYQGCCGLCYSDRDVEQAVKEAYSDIDKSLNHEIPRDCDISENINKIFKDKFGFELE